MYIEQADADGTSTLTVRLYQRTPAAQQHLLCFAASHDWGINLEHVRVVEHACENEASHRGCLSVSVTIVGTLCMF